LKPLTKILIVVVATCIVIGGILAWKALVPSKTVLKVFHAGSLAVPFKEIEETFEGQHPNVDVQREPMGSVKAVRQITDVGKQADVLAVADYSLIPDMMYTEYADWYVRFARNEMVLAYDQEKSSYADEINSTNWYNIIRREGVTFGFSNPNLDPCGYRAVMITQLAELYYNDSEIFDDLILSNTAITVSEENETYLIRTPEDLAPNTGKVIIRSKSVDLVTLIEEGGLDYAFEYRSVAVQHNLKFVNLPEKINLGKVEYADFYGKVRLEKADGKTCTGKPVVYGITVPKNAPNPSLGLEFIKLVLNETGRETFQNCGQPPIVPAVGSGNLPDELGSLVRLETGIQWTLTMVGNETVVLSFDDIFYMPPYEGWGGLMTSTGRIVGPFRYKGVALNYLCDLVGGVNESNSIRVTAKDGYSMTFTYNQLNGDFVTYDPTTGEEVPHGELEMVLAYEEDGKFLTEEHGGPLRLVIVGSEKLVTEGHYWVKWVNKIEIKSVVEEWTLTLKGSITEIMDRATFESGVSCHGVTWTDSKNRNWTGIPLWLLVGRVDDELKHGEDAFNDTLADLGYTVKIIASDGYNITLNSNKIKRNNNIIVANELNDKPLPEKYWPLRLVGSDLEKSEMIRNVVEIDVVFSSPY